jgi:phosphoenolpyruvate synthase/pyruvate phosphate dikinase
MSVVTSDLASDDARSPERCGAKASSLARAASRGLPTVPGFVITTAGHEIFLAAGRTVRNHLETEIATFQDNIWKILSKNGRYPL